MSSGLSTVTVTLVAPGATLAPFTGSFPPAVPTTVKSEVDTEPPSASSNEIVIVVPPSDAVAVTAFGGVRSAAPGAVNVTLFDVRVTPSTVVVNVAVSGLASVAVNVATPPASVKVCAETAAVPLPVTVTSFEPMATPLASASVTVTVVAAVPSATTEAGEALIDEWPASTGPGPPLPPVVYVIEAVSVRLTESVVSSALYVTVSGGVAVVSLTVNVARPTPFVAAVAASPGLPAGLVCRVAVLPATVAFVPSRSVTVIVAVVPSGATVPAEAVIVERAGSTTPAPPPPEFVTCRIVESVNAPSVPVTVWSPAVAGSQRLPAQVPSGAIPKVVAALSFHELPYASWPVEVKAEFVPTPTVPAGPETVIPVSGPVTMEGSAVMSSV